jgi:carbohydrate-binding DOMON domain-containing protein
MTELSLQLDIHDYYLELKLMYRKRSYAIFSYNYSYTDNYWWNPIMLRWNFSIDAWSIFCFSSHQQYYFRAITTTVATRNSK